jgi:hypothetical protein
MWSIGDDAYGGGPSSSEVAEAKPAKNRTTTKPARNHMVAQIFILDTKLVRIHKGRLFSGIGKAGLDGLRCERPTFRVLVAEVG